MTWWLGIFVFVVLPVMVGIVVGALRRKHVRLVWRDSGWVYFLAADQGPVKVGMMRTHPVFATSKGLPRVVYQYHTNSATEAVQRIDKMLEGFRHHGEWYDRDAALALVDELKGVIG